jgi:hypothetical protein
MNQFVFESKQKNFFIGMMVLGLVCMILTYVTDHDSFHTRFWTNFLHNSVFFMGIGFAATFLIAAKITAYSGWHTIFKRIWEAYSLFIIVGIVLMAVIAGGVWMHYHHLYHWANVTPEELAKDRVLRGKISFLNPVFYTIATFGFAGAWYFFATKFRKLSIEQDQDDYNPTYPKYKQMKVWAAAFLPIAGFTSAAAIWQWIMSVDAHWYSTMFAWYTTASWVVTMIASTILMILYLKSKGYMEEVSYEHIHDLGKYMFAFSIFWMYLWFSQFMLIWYANIGEETIYFHKRMKEFPILYWANIIMNFFLPFLILIRNDSKRKNGILVFTATLIICGHWLDFFQMVKLGPLETAHHAAGAAGAAHQATGMIPGFSIPGFYEIGTFIGFIGLFLYFVFNQFTKASLVPKNDAYLAEAVHHHV